MPELFLGDGRQKAHDRKDRQREEQRGAEMRRASRATRMLLAHRLRAIREKKGLSQSDISSRMALRNGYVARVENGQFMPRLRILERWAHVLEVPLYQFFYDGKTPPEPLRVSKQETFYEVAVDGSQERYFNQLRQLLPRMNKSKRVLLLEMAQTIYIRRRHGPARGLLPAQRQVVPKAMTG